MTLTMASMQDEQPPAQPGTQLPRVLIVDDDAGMRAYIRECLAVLPVRVAEASDGHDALAQIRGRAARDLALVISDIVMPGLDGRGLKAALQAEPEWAEVPVLLISGEAVRGRDGPVLRKPFNARRLCAVVQVLLDRCTRPG